MPREWKLDILLRNLENDWESMIKMSFTVTSSYLNKDNMAPLTIHCEALPIGKRLNKIFWFQDPFSFSSHFSFLCAFDRRPPPDVWTANARDAERTPSAALKPRGWDERELGCYLHKSSVSSSPSYLWKVPSLVGGSHAGRTDAAVRPLQSETRASKAWSRCDGTSVHSSFGYRETRRPWT